MGTGNFRQGDETYIYVPKIFSDIRNLSEAELEFLYQDFFDTELPTIIEAVNEELERIQKFVYKKYKDGEIEIVLHDKKYNSHFGIQLYSVEIIENDGYHMDSATIYYGFVSGYYEAGNMVYLIENSENLDKGFVFLERIVGIIEKVYSRFCDKYEVSYRASNGEVGYTKL